MDWIIERADNTSLFASVSIKRAMGGKEEEKLFIQHSVSFVQYVTLTSTMITTLHMYTYNRKIAILPVTEVTSIRTTTVYPITG